MPSNNDELPLQLWITLKSLPQERRQAFLALALLAKDPGAVGSAVMAGVRSLLYARVGIDDPEDLAVFIARSLQKGNPAEPLIVPLAALPEPPVGRDRDVVLLEVRPNTLGPPRWPGELF